MSAIHEVTRQTQDRLVFLEVDHSRLAGQVDARYAENQEFEDFVQNRSEEDWLEITGDYFIVSDFDLMQVNVCISPFLLSRVVE